MNIRVISGRYGSRKLDAPDGATTHPMSERIRNALFNSLGADIVGTTVLDAFAGSGAVGIEALSRGAAHATFIERDRIAHKIIAKNLETLGIDDAKLIRATIASWDQTSDQLFDIVFADPPYHDVQLPTLARLAAHVVPGGRLIVSLPDRQAAPTFDGVSLVSERPYGNAKLAIYVRE